MIINNSLKLTISSFKKKSKEFISLNNNNNNNNKVNIKASGIKVQAN